jgi:serine/threonine protein phosphatase 1
MKIFAVGDIHGAHKALLQVLERSGFDYENDQLIQLGDIVDGWHETYETIEELLKIKNLILIRGNHDLWFHQFLKTGDIADMWFSQGGNNTLESFIANGVMNNHYTWTDLAYWRKIMTFFQKQMDYYIDSKDRGFVHAGHLEITLGIEVQESNYYWSRRMWQNLLNYGSAFQSTAHVELYIGHTTTSREFPDLKPVNIGKVWNLDQGAGWEGKLTLMKIDTKEYCQSDIVKSLYPNAKGRS